MLRSFNQEKTTNATTGASPVADSCLSNAGVVQQMQTICKRKALRRPNINRTPWRLRTFTELMEEDHILGLGVKTGKRECPDENDIELGSYQHKRIRTNLLGPKMKKRLLDWAGV